MVVFDDVIADMLNDKNGNPVVIELFIKRRKLNISLVFITQSYFVVPKTILHLNLNLHIISLWKFQTNKSFNKWHLIRYWLKDFVNHYKNVM